MQYDTIRPIRWSPIYEFRAFTNNDEVCEECGAGHAVEHNGYRMCEACRVAFWDDIRRDALEGTY